ncbi:MULTISPECIES: acyl-CoA dehydrogenase family protein [Gordonia]|uniref:acyl-CoA dehydrogenase family protein n=1 Tax=Gordonia TaxID=2053 RepID=UPI000AFC8DDD|nr:MULTISPECIES: acyl-CoA dehydrogenase family protein [Gordonia]
MTVIDSTKTSVRKQIPVPEPGLTVDDFLARARGLRDRLREEQAETERRTRYSPELHEEFRRLGFYRMLQPAALGGYELSIQDFLRVVVEIGRGCPSTAWCLCLGSAHVVNLAGLFDADVQAEAMGADGHFIAPSRVVPSVTATPVDGGWELNGLWDYCSGVPYSTHVFNAVMIMPADGGRPHPGLALVPRDKYEVLDDWGTLIGLKGSGSNSVKVDHCVVDHGYVLDIDINAIRPDQTYGLELYGNPMYIGPIQPFFFAELLAVALGMTKAMFDEFAATMPVKKTMWPPMAVRAEDSFYRQWYGEATTLIDQAEACLLSVTASYTQLCAESAATGRPVTIAENQRLVSLAIQAGKVLTEAMDLMARVTGSSAMKDGTRTQRYWRDFTMYRSHVAQTIREATASGYAVAALAEANA